MKLFIKLFVLLILAGTVAAGYVIYTQYQAFIREPIALAEGTKSTFVIKPGSNIRQVARQLKDTGVLAENRLIPADLLFVAQARLLKKATLIKAGEYELEAGMTPATLLERFVSGKTIQYQVSIIEGRTFRDIIQTVSQNADLVKKLSAEDYKDLMPRLGAPAGMSPEGWFLPDTYFFPRNSSDEDVLKRSYQAMQDYLQQAWEKREPHVHIKTPYDALILASIVEKETGVGDERPLISRVFLNRLEKGMMLQTDPTVIYGMGDAYQGNIRKKDLQTDTPYNTYTRTGLPPTPIATPGKAAIDAVLHPADSDYLYFVATGEGDGRHYFSKTYEEHRRAVIKYQLNGNSARYKGDAKQ